MTDLDRITGIMGAGKSYRMDIVTGHAGRRFQLLDEIVGTEGFWYAVELGDGTSLASGLSVCVFQHEPSLHRIQDERESMSRHIFLKRVMNSNLNEWFQVYESSNLCVAPSDSERRAEYVGYRTGLHLPLMDCLCVDHRRIVQKYLDEHPDERPLL